MLRLRTVDDRRRCATLYRTGLLPLRSPGEHPVRPEAWARARREVWTFMVNQPASFKDMTRYGLVQALFLGLLPGTAWMLAMGIAWATGAFPLGMVVLFVPAFGGCLAVILWKRRCGFYETRPRVIIGAMLRQWLCPACGYSLRVVPLADDGCRVCPECGGAWRIEGATVEGRPASDPRGP